MKSHLQVKVFSMAAEMSYIRRKEEQWKNRARYARQKQAAALANSGAVRAEGITQSLAYAENAFWSLRFHRDGMKFDARHNHLAYGFMKGRSYEQMEHICYGVIKGFGSSEPQWELIAKIVQRFTKDETAPQVWMQSFAEWLEAAKVWYDGNKGRIEAFNQGRPARLAALKATKKPYVPPKTITEGGTTATFSNEQPKATGGALPAASNASQYSG